MVFEGILPRPTEHVRNNSGTPPEPAGRTGHDSDTLLKSASCTRDGGDTSLESTGHIRYDGGISLKPRSRVGDGITLSQWSVIRLFPSFLFVGTHVSSVTNVGMVPFANANNVVVNNPTFYDIQIAPDQVASGKSYSMNFLIPVI